MTCDHNGAVGLARALVLAVIANQSVYKLSPKTVKAARPADDPQLPAPQPER